MTRLCYDAVDHFLSAAHRLHANTQPHIPHPNPDTAPTTMAQHESHEEKSHLPHEVSSGPFKLRRHLSLSKPFLSPLSIARACDERDVFRARTNPSTIDSSLVAFASLVESLHRRSPIHARAVVRNEKQRL